MAINFNAFIRDIKKGTNAAVGGYRKSKFNKKLSTTLAKPMKNSRIARKGDENAVDMIMKKYYPSYTNVGVKTYGKRRKEFLSLYRDKGPKEVITRAKYLKAQFKKDNPVYKG